MGQGPGRPLSPFFTPAATMAQTGSQTARYHGQAEGGSLVEGTRVGAGTALTAR